MAAVVIKKQLLAELYFFSGCTSAQRWSSLYQPPAAGTAAADAVQYELWVNQTVSFDNLDVSEPAGNGQQAAVAGARHRCRRQHRSIHWSDVHALLMECIAGNAARCSTVANTAVVPPGTTAAAKLEQQLAGLAALGAPVLDLRRMQYGPGPGPADSTGVIGHPAFGSSSNTRRRRAGSDMQGLAGRGHAANCSCILPNGSDNLRVSAGTAMPGAAGTSLTAMQQHWSSRVAAVQAALSAAVARRVAIGAPQPTLQSLDDASFDVLSAAIVLDDVVMQLYTLAPEVQVLVLPLLLPGVQVGHTVPGGWSGSSKLDALHLLSLNAFYLKTLRHECDKLQHLKQVLLMAGPPAAVPQPPTAEVAGTRDSSSRPAAGFDSTVGSSDRGVASANQQCQHAACGTAKQLLPQRVVAGATRGVESNEQQIYPWGKGGAVPGYILDAVQGMVLSCMDRPIAGYQ